MPISGFLLFLLILNAYLLLVFLAARSGLLARFNVGLMGPALMFRTNRGKGTIDWISKPKRFHIVTGTVGIWVTLTLMGLLMLLLIVQLPLIFRIPVEEAPQARHILALPGINPLIPIGYGIVALIAAIVIHEFAHGVLARAQDLKVKSLGILYLVVPIGAFVEPDEEELKVSSRRNRMRVYAAGPMSNIVTALVLGFVFSAGFVAAATPVEDGLGIRLVVPESPAGQAGLEPGMMVTAIGGRATEDVFAFRDALNATAPGQRIDVQTARHGVFSLCLASREDAQRLGELGPGVDWCARYAEAPRQAMSPPEAESGLVANLSAQPAWTAAGAEVTFSFDAAESGDGAFTWRFEPGDGSAPRTGTEADLPREERHAYALEGAYTASFTLEADGASATAELVVNVGGFLGVEMYPFSPAEIQDRLANPFQDLGSLALYVALPFTGITPMTSPLTDMYEVPLGDSAGAKQAYWVSANVVYWVMWISLMLGLTNALPAVPLDGGWLFRDFLDGVVHRLKPNSTAEGRARFVKRASLAVSLLVLALILVQFVGPRIAPLFA